MRKVKTIKINDREITIKELTVRQIWQIVQPEKTKDGAQSENSILGRIDTFLEMSCPEMTREVVMDMAPSELTAVWTVFEEVNADFLGLIRKLGLEKIVMEQINLAIDSAKTDLTGLSAVS